MTTTAWHWPDHCIGKRESRRLREEHNVIANSQAELLQALIPIVHSMQASPALRANLPCDMLCRACAAIAKAQGGEQ